MGVLLAVAAAVLLLVAALIGPDDPSAWLRAVYLFAQWSGPLLLLLSALYFARGRLLDGLRRALIEIAGPALIRTMAPRAVLDNLLSRVFGDRTGHDVIISGLLGGAGRDSSGRDTAVSRGTTVNCRLQRISDQMVLSEITWTHEYSGIRDNYQLVVFATWDRGIARLVVTERVFPLFELWVVKDEDELEDFVPELLKNLRVGIRYRDADGLRHEVDPRPHDGAEVEMHQYGKFIRLPDNVDRGDLRIVKLDLHDLADDDHVVGAIEHLTLSASSVASFDLRYMVWSPPHPCYVHSVRFDIRELARPHEDLVFLVLSSTMQRAGLPINKWTRSDDGIVDVPIKEWMMPGHGVTLLWRLVE